MHRTRQAAAPGRKNQSLSSTLMASRLGTGSANTREIQARHRPNPRKSQSNVRVEKSVRALGKVRINPHPLDAAEASSRPIGNGDGGVASAIMAEMKVRGKWRGAADGSAEVPAFCQLPCIILERSGKLLVETDEILMGMDV